jgi:plastocyanin
MMSDRRRRLTWQLGTLALFVFGAIAVAAIALVVEGEDDSRVEARSFMCRPADDTCAQRYLVAVTAASGPRAAITLVERLKSDGRLAASVDEHQLAHHIGRETARRFGVNGASFARCTSALNYGCAHGFFEYALGRAASPQAAAVTICDTGRDEGISRFSCYHGVGHGVLMAKAYDLGAALAICDSLSDAIAQDGCWQGAFMENVNAGLRNEARPGTFRANDPFAPCSHVAARHLHECYINHAGWLMHLAGNDLAKAATLCLRLTSQLSSTCAQSLGLMVTNPSWQATLTGGSQAGEVERTAWTLCGRFPRALRRDCVIGGLDNLANFEGLDLTRTSRFCSIVSSERAICYRQLGLNLRRRTSAARARALCAELRSGSAACVAGTRDFVPQQRVRARVVVERSAAKPPPAPATIGARVEMRARAFSPRIATIDIGEAVTFVNVGAAGKWPASNPHPVHTLYQGFDAGRVIAPGTSWSFTFTARGRWTYHDHLSPEIEAVIVVR